MDSDITFITNEKNQTLLDRFKMLIEDTQFFNVSVDDLLK
jgi:HKD family nuclease